MLIVHRGVNTPRHFKNTPPPILGNPPFSKNPTKCVNAVHSIQITEQLLRQTYSEHCQTFKMEHSVKRIMPECRCATRNFSGQGSWGFCGTRALR